MVAVLHIGEGAGGLGKLEGNMVGRLCVDICPWEGSGEVELRADLQMQVCK
jgi:hypothetical protein